MFRTLSKVRANRSSMPTAIRRSSTQTPPTDHLTLALKNLRGKPKFGQLLGEIRTSSLYSEVWEWSNVESHRAPGFGELHTNPHLRNAASAYAICYALDAVVHLSHKYKLRLVELASTGSEPSILEHEFLAQIEPTHAKLLTHDFLKAWDKNSTIRQAAILSALQPELTKKLQLERTTAHAECEAAWGPIPAEWQLTEAEFLALIDYLNSLTGTFNAINGAAIAEAYYHEPILNQAVAAFSAALNRAIKKLCCHPYFGKRNIGTYKGVKLTEQAGPFRHAMLKAAATKGFPIAFPNVVSATSDPKKSYAFSKAGQGYLLELFLVMRIGCDADAFHDENTVGECEILGPAGQKFLVTHVEQIEVPMPESGHWTPIDRYVLKPKV